MQEGRARRPLFSPLVCLLGLLLPLTWSCNLPPSAPSSSQTGSSTAEAEKTRKMEEKAAEIERHAEEIRTMQGTDQEKSDAMNRLDEERRELNEMQEQGGGDNP
jgi:hypothetical protein